jgi:alpha-1,2-mannosyltransferase
VPFRPRWLRPQVAGASPLPAWRRWLRPWLIAGVAVFAVALAGYLAFTFSEPAIRWSFPVDLHVYRFSGFIARHIGPTYDPRRASPLYNWPGYLELPFTYPPFAALIFSVLTFVPWAVLPDLTIGLSILALLAVVWTTARALGVRDRAQAAGLTLVIAGVSLWLEPVQRNLYLGQVELVLMALILWDLCQPDRRWWKGAGVGIAAGIKLVPLIFIPYLLLTRRFRQAAVATVAFWATAGLGFAVLPADSRAWWLGLDVLHESRTGFVGWEGNQSLQALITRLMGSVAAAAPVWLAVAIVTLIAGVAGAALLSRAGQPVLGVITCALTGLLVSPVSWDHHWVWIVPVITVLVVFGLRLRRALRWTCLGAAVFVGALYAAWPDTLWGRPQLSSGFWMGLIWMPPLTSPNTYRRLGDQPRYAEYHWRGIELLTGNLYVLTGLAMFVALLVAAIYVARRRKGRGQPRTAWKPRHLADSVDVLLPAGRDLATVGGPQGRQESEGR